MIEKIRLEGKRLFRCSTCSTMFNRLGDSDEHPCRFNYKVNNKQSFNKGESDGLRATSEKPVKRSYNIEIPLKGFSRSNG